MTIFLRCCKRFLESYALELDHWTLIKTQIRLQHSDARQWRRCDAISASEKLYLTTKRGPLALELPPVTATDFTGVESHFKWKKHIPINVCWDRFFEFQMILLTTIRSEAQHRSIFCFCFVLFDHCVVKNSCNKYRRIGQCATNVIHVTLCSRSLQWNSIL